MAHLGDYDASSVIYGKFTTYRPSTGAAFTLGGTPALSVYKDNSTTQSTTGVTLTADFDSLTGFNHFAIDTSADGAFYAAGSNFDIVITTGTVDGVSVVGAVVASFTVRKGSALKPATAGRTLVVDAAGLADANAVKIGPTGAGTAQTARDIGASVLLSSGIGTGQLKLAAGYVAMTWADIAAPTTTVNLSATTIAAVAGAVGSVTGAVASVTGNVGGNVMGSVGSVVGLTAANLDVAVSTRASATNLATAQTTLNKVDDTLEDDGGTFRFTANALEEGPTGGAGLDAAGVRAAIGMASANLDAQLADLPTNAELATALAAADDATLAAIASLATSVGTIPDATEVADAVLKRDWTAITGEASRSLLNAARWTRNGFWIDSDGVAHILKEDDATDAYTRQLGTDASADPIVSVGAAP